MAQQDHTLGTSGSQLWGQLRANHLLLSTGFVALNARKEPLWRRKAWNLTEGMPDKQRQRDTRDSRESEHIWLCRKKSSFLSLMPAEPDLDLFSVMSHLSAWPWNPRSGAL